MQTDLARAGFHVIEDNNIQERVVIGTRGAFACMEDRPLVPPHDRLANGPNLVGGVFGLAALLDSRGIITQQGIKKAIGIIEEHQHTATIHDATDGHKCGFAEKVFNNRITGASFDSSFHDLDEIYEFAQKEGALKVSVNEEGYGHTGRIVRFNLLPGTTFVANGSAFQTDLGELVANYGLDQKRVIDLTAATLAALHGPAYGVIVR